MNTLYGCRDSLCAIALAASQETKDDKAPASSSLHLQVAKVVSAHAASVADSLLGVPLLCSAGAVLSLKLEISYNVSRERKW